MYQQTFDEKLMERFFNTTDSLIMNTITLFYCYKNVFILINIWIIGKKSMKHHYFKQRILQSLKFGLYYIHRLCARKKSLYRFWNKKILLGSKQHIIVSWYIWELSIYISWNIWASSCYFSLHTRISMASRFKQDESKITFFHWYWNVLIGRKSC